LQGSEEREQRTEDRKQKTENRKQRTEDRKQRFEFGSGHHSIADFRFRIADLDKDEI
jgi:hypothetical protein